MADDQHRKRGYPPSENPDERRYHPSDEDDERKQYHLPPVAPRPTALPSMTAHPPPQPQGAGFPPEYRHSERGYAPDQRYPPDQSNWSSVSPTNSNGYPPPPPDQRYQLPPVQMAQERPRDYNGGRQYPERRQYGERRQYPDQYYQGQPPPPPPAPHGGAGVYVEPYQYRFPPPGPQYPYDYTRVGANAPPPAPPPPQQAAPRQRTSIACRYCRKRKIRCSGYANTTNGKCTNCDKLRIDCVFQPVSSNSSAAFVPVSAVPGGVPPGTPLYGAYGQPLHQSSGQGPPQQQQHQQQQRPYPQTPSDYQPSLHSPTGQYPPYDERGEPTRRRTRPSEEEHAMRLPPPNYPPDEDPRRRSPASNPSTGTPPTAYRQYPQGAYEQERSPSPRRNSPNGHAPAQQQLTPSTASQTPQQQAPPAPSSASSSNNPMSLNHLMGPDPQDRKSGHDIDRNMLGRLNRRN